MLLLSQRYAMDAAFYMAKELLMTERTYKKDLQVIVVVSDEKCEVYVLLQVVMQ